MIRTAKWLTVTSILVATFVGCKKAGEETAPGGASSSEMSKGVGPVSSVTVGPLDAALAAKGEKLFSEKCTACHKIEERVVGPALKGVTTRRAPEWIMNMILNPMEMTQKDETAKGLLGEYLTQMTNQNLDQDGARAVLEFFRRNDGAK